MKWSPGLKMLGLLLCAGAALGHPMGNFSVGQHATLLPGRDGLAMRYVLDFAEMPTYNLRPEMGVAPADAITQAHVEAERERAGAAWLGRLAVTLDGRAVALAASGGRAVLTPGAGGLPTVRFELEARGAWPVAADGAHELGYSDANFPDRVGWKEVVVRAGDGARLLSATAPVTDRTAGLTRYPDEAAQAPMAVREARARVLFEAPRRDPRVAPAGEGGAGSAVPAPPEPLPARSPVLLAVLVMAVLAAGGVIAARRA